MSNYDGYFPRPTTGRTRRRHRLIIRLAEAQNHRCAYCLRQLAYTVIGERPICSLSNARPTIDHFIPTSAGGSNTVDNMVIACYRCNNKKQSKDSLMYYKTKVFRFILDTKLCFLHRKYYLSVKI
jgi:5-methylcytosine-specific restriction endonuclease McrA